MPAADDDSDYSEFAALQSSEDAANVTCMFCDAAFAECSATQLLQRISTMKYGSSVRQVMCNLWDHNEEEIVDVGENPISDQSILSKWSTMSLATSNYNT
ncbi:hypothetical protein QE152_g1712 [Popillia japonica]|uniref:Uncharacterized protein n=1 Tax=Popillia japonica TaxID=7064 RepID=A0AAW1N5Q5_POPJA